MMMRVIYLIGQLIQSVMTSDHDLNVRRGCLILDDPTVT